MCAVFTYLMKQSLHSEKMGSLLKRERGGGGGGVTHIIEFELSHLNLLV